MPGGGALKPPQELECFSRRHDLAFVVPRDKLLLFDAETEQRVAD